MAGTMRQTKTITFQSAGTLSGTGISYSSPFDVSGYSQMDLYINVTSISGTSPSLTISFQSGSAEADAGYTVTTFASIGATGKYNKQVTQIGAFAQLEYVLAGTSPAFGVTIVGIAKT